MALWKIRIFIGHLSELLSQRLKVEVRPWGEWHINLSQMQCMMNQLVHVVQISEVYTMKQLC